MTENEQKQQMSVAYVHAVAARAGYACQPTIVDEDSVDVTIAAKGKVHDHSVALSPRLELQLKASSQPILAENHLAFPLPVKNSQRSTLRYPRPAVAHCVVTARRSCTLA